MFFQLYYMDFNFGTSKEYFCTNLLRNAEKSSIIDYRSISYVTNLGDWGYSWSYSHSSSPWQNHWASSSMSGISPQTTCNQYSHKWISFQDSHTTLYGHILSHDQATFKNQGSHNGYQQSFKLSSFDSLNKKLSFGFCLVDTFSDNFSFISVN